MAQVKIYTAAMQLKDLLNKAEEIGANVADQIAVYNNTNSTLEEIQASEQLSMMLPYLDVLVDGPFILEQRDTTLLFRGSPNQRIIYLHGAPPEDVIPGTVPLEPLR